MIDTASDRAQALGFGVGVGNTPMPDGALALGDRAQIMGGYALDVPYANFVMNKTSGYVPLNVYFFDTSVSVSDIISWLWDFGDGGMSTDQNSEHTYTAPGVYTISLRIWNDAGLTDIETKSRVLRVALATRALKTHDEAPPQGDELLSHMVDTGDGSANIHPIGVKYYIRRDISSPSKSGFKRPAGPSLIFD